MSRKFLGQPFDIHCGGVDHVSLHHTNEIAQSEAAFGRPLARYWLHGEFLVVPSPLEGEGQGEGIKMAKTGDHFITLESVVKERFNPLAFRYLTLNTHYRQKINFSWEALQAAASALENLYNTVRYWDKPKIGCAKLEQKFLEAINNDLNMPQALASVWETVKSDYPASAKARSLLKFDQILGLNLKAYLGQRPKIPAAVQKLAKQREQARQQKNWALSDELRKKIEVLGYEVRDVAGDRTEVVQKTLFS